MKLEDKESCFTVASRSVSSLQWQDTFASTTVVKVQSKTNFEEEESTNSMPFQKNTHSKTSEKSPPSFPNRKHPERNVKPNSELGNHDSLKQGKCHFSSTRNQNLHLDGVGNTEDRIISDSFFSSPFELVEIYSNKRDHNNFYNLNGFSDVKQEDDLIRTLSEEDSEFVQLESSGENIFVPLLKSTNLNKEALSIIGDKEKCLKENGTACAKKFSNTFLYGLQDVINIESTREQQNFRISKHRKDLKEKCKTILANNPDNLNGNLAPASSQILSNANNTENWKEMETGLPKTDSELIDRFKKDLIHCNTKTINRSFAIKQKVEESGSKNLCNQYSSKSNKSRKDVISKKENVKNNNLPLNREEYLSFSSKESIINLDSLNWKESRTTKSSFRSEETSVTELWNLKSTSQVTSTTTNTNESDSSVDKRNINAAKGNTFNVRIENKNKNIMAENDVKTMNNNASEMLTIDQNCQREIINCETENSKGKTVKLETKEKYSDYEDLPICKILKKIYDQLCYNGEKATNIVLKFETIHPSTEFDDLRILLQRLNNIIVRCKSYINGSNNSYEAEMEITELLSNYIDKLNNAVQTIQRTVEMQDFFHTQAVSLQEQSRIKQGKYFILTWNRSIHEIAGLIESISSLMKNVSSKCEEKENFRSPRKYKSVHCHTRNNLYADSYKQKNKIIRSKNTKVNLVKKDSSVETQMTKTLNSISSIKQCNSKTFVKPVQTAKNLEKEKHVDVEQNSVVEKKNNECGRHLEKGKHLKKPILCSSVNQPKQLVSRQKHRVLNSSQPIWKPGGTVKIPVSSSTTLLTQENRPLSRTKDKINQPLDNMKTATNTGGCSLDYIVIKRSCLNIEKTIGDGGKESKQDRSSTNEPQKKITESYLSKDSELFPENDNIKLPSSPRSKPKTGTLKTTTKDYEYVQHASDSIYSKSCNNTSPQGKIGQKKMSKDSRVLRILEEILKFSPGDKKNDENKKCLVDYKDFPDQKNLLHMEHAMEPISLDEIMETNEKESTIDLNSAEPAQNRLIINDTLVKKPLPADKLLEKPSTSPILSKDIILLPMDKVEEVKSPSINVNLQENAQRNPNLSFISIANASCTVNFNSSSDSASQVGSSKCLQTSQNSVQSLNRSNLEPVNAKLEERNVSEEVLKREQKVLGGTAILSTAQEKRSKTMPLKSRAMSLNMLKEFLCSQGVDVDLVNRAEKCLRDKEKCLKKKSVNFAHIPFSKSIREDKSEKRSTIAGNWEKNSIPCKTDFNIELEKKDIATSTERTDQDASSQTGLEWSSFKSSQTDFDCTIRSTVKLQSVETQTEVTSVRHVAIECHKESRSVSAMTESLSVADNFTETISYISKSVTTEIVADNFVKKLDKSVQKNCSSSDKLVAESKEECTQTTSYSSTFDQLLNQMQQYCDDLTNYKKNSEINELDFAELNLVSSGSSDLSSEFSETCHETETKVSNEIIAENACSKVMAALEIAAIGEHNVYKFVDVYERNIRSKMQKLEDRMNRERKSKRCTELRKEISNIEQSNSVATFVIPNSDQFSKNDITQVSKALRQTEITFINEEYLDINVESEYETKKLSSVSNTTFVSSSSSENAFTSINSGISKKSSSVTVKDVKSLVEFLLQETENAKFEQICLIQKSDSCSTFHSTMQSIKVTPPNSVFSRENLLPLVYGVLCSVVFWCLQFTITCDVIS